MAEDQQLSIKRIYLKDASLETPGTPGVFLSKWEPTVHVDVNTKAEQLADDMNEVILTLTATAKVDDKPALLIEVQQAGLFSCKGLNEQQLRQALSTVCPDILYPYAREAVDAMAVKASFPPFQLAPMNFDAMYQQALEQKQKQQDSEEPTH